jgi:hypothetical protein
MKLLTSALKAKLMKNSAAKGGTDHVPVVKFFTPDGAATWLFTELDGDSLFGLCDLGFGSPELGYASLSELEKVRGALGLPIERDLYFKASKTLSAYAEEASSKGRISA